MRSCWKRNNNFRVSVEASLTSRAGRGGRDGGDARSEGVASRGRFPFRSVEKEVC